MKRCRWCKGAGWVYDNTWCRDEACCPERLTCLPCAGTGEMGWNPLPPPGGYTAADF